VPDRTISERIRRSESLDRLSPEAERLFWRMVTVADDAGRLDGRPGVVRADCFKRQDITDEDVGYWLTEIEDAGIIVRYMARTQIVIEFVNWGKHQPIAEPKPSAFPSREEAAIINGRRAYGVPRARTRTRADARTVLTSLSTTHRVVEPIGSTPVHPGLNGVVTTPAVPKRAERRVGGAGGRLSDIVPDEVKLRPEPPDILLEFDEVLSANRDYWPTAKFFERVAERFTRIPGLDIAYEAEGMVEWLRLHPERKRRDIPRFAERWLTRAKEDAEKQQRSGRPFRQREGADSGAARWRMGGKLSTEAVQSADKMAERGRAHYADE
jgi:hypothetical protein